MVLMAGMSLIPMLHAEAASCEGAMVGNVAANAEYRYHVAANTIDGNLATYWSSYGKGSWIKADLESPKSVCSVDVAWYKGDRRSYSFAISTSEDGMTFKQVYSGKSAKSLQLQRYEFADVPARYVKITVYGNTIDRWAAIAEIKVNAAVEGVQDSPLPTGSRMLYDDFSGPTYTLADGQVSANNKWKNVYNGYGASGVRADGANNVFFEHPLASSSSSETHAALVLTTSQYDDFELSLDVRTDDQLRQGGTPNTWEVAWIMFRFGDNWHHYYFTLKTNGIELGKKDNDRQAEEQVFLYTAGQPANVIGSWSHLDIRAVGNHITVWVDGKKAIDYYDSTISAGMETGSIGLYTEDAAVSFDNVFITPLG